MRATGTKRKSCRRLRRELPTPLYFAQSLHFSATWAKLFSLCAPSTQFWFGGVELLEPCRSRGKQLRHDGGSRCPQPTREGVVVTKRVRPGGVPTLGMGRSFGGARIVVESLLDGDNQSDCTLGLVTPVVFSIRTELSVTAEADGDREPRLLFTAPWEPLIVRRGDALGLRALADQFADAVAPDLSNRVRDGRWVTILAWCLVRSQEVFHASGGRSLTTRSEQRERYAWLRPLELMWVARTIALAGDDWRDRSLAGQRRVLPWYA